MAGDAVVKIACAEGVRSSYVSTLARRSGLPPRRGWQRRYPLDETAFDEPSAVGWWLIGLLAADGSINEKEHRISLSQRGEDADVLHAFLDYVGASERPLTELSWRNRPAWCRAESHYYEARIFSERICRALASHGVVPRKSRSLSFGEEAARRPQIWLGFLDGDGSVLRSSGNERPPRISFYGPEPVMRQCSAFWGSQLTLRTAKAPTVRYHARGLYTVSVHGANAARAARQMLDSSEISLRRKRLLLEEVAASTPTSTGNDNPNGRQEQWQLPMSIGS